MRRESSTHMRSLRVIDFERRAQVVQIRGAARKGSSPQEIAELTQLPIATVQRVLTVEDHPRVSDPARLLQARRDIPGMAPAHVQLYWLGFLTAAGHIYGQGSSLTLVVTLGEKSRAYIAAFLGDLSTEDMHFEVCRSSIVGKQAYIRDQSLCRALFPWGVPSDLHGQDPSVLDDLPEEFAVPFIRGYAEGDWPARWPRRGRMERPFILHGTPAVLAGINSMVQRFWAMSGGVVTPEAGRTELRFSDPESCRTLHGRLSMFVSGPGAAS